MSILNWELFKDILDNFNLIKGLTINLNNNSFRLLNFLMSILVFFTERFPNKIILISSIVNVIFWILLFFLRFIFCSLFIIPTSFNNSFSISKHLKEFLNNKKYFLRLSIRKGLK